LEAAFPLGDSEILYRIRERCTDVRTHPAGTTVLLEATIAGCPHITPPASSQDAEGGGYREPGGRLSRTSPRTGLAHTAALRRDHPQAYRRHPS
jgi:hypothetical protein